MLKEIQICIMQAVVLIILPLMIIAGIWNLLF